MRTRSLSSSSGSRIAAHATMCGKVHPGVHPATLAYRDWYRTGAVLHRPSRCVVDRKHYSKRTLESFHLLQGSCMIYRRYSVFVPSAPHLCLAPTCKHAYTHISAVARALPLLNDQAAFPSHVDVNAKV
jgi:hypothetical protein